MTTGIGAFVEGICIHNPYFIRTLYPTVEIYYEGKGTVKNNTYNPITPADLEYRGEVPQKCRDCIWRRGFVCTRVTCVKELNYELIVGNGHRSAQDEREQPHRLTSGSR